MSNSIIPRVPPIPERRDPCRIEVEELPVVLILFQHFPNDFVLVHYFPSTSLEDLSVPLLGHLHNSPEFTHPNRGGQTEGCPWHFSSLLATGDLHRRRQHDATLSVRFCHTGNAFR